MDLRFGKLRESWRDLDGKVGCTCGANEEIAYAEAPAADAREMVGVCLGLSSRMKRVGRDLFKF